MNTCEVSGKTIVQKRELFVKTPEIFLRSEGTKKKRRAAGGPPFFAGAWVMLRRLNRRALEFYLFIDRFLVVRLFIVGLFNLGRCSGLSGCTGGRCDGRWGRVGRRHGCRGWNRLIRSYGLCFAGTQDSGRDRQS